ncbi:MAG: hypothetical protein AAFR93_00220 [Pseudomonadota bacterium]
MGWIVTRNFVLLVAMMLGLGQAHAGALPEQERSPCPEYENLVLYVSHTTGWPIGDVCPKMIFTSSHPLAIGVNLGRPMEMETGATFYPASGAIKLSVQTDLNNVVGMALLVHQIVHAFQYDLGLDRGTPCTLALEKEAYRVQSQFLADNGYEEEARLVARMAEYRSMCPQNWLARD